MDDLRVLQNAFSRIRDLEEENIRLRIKLEQVRLAHIQLERYIEHNTLNFQLEKAEYFIREIGIALANDID